MERLPADGKMPVVELQTEGLQSLARPKGPAMSHALLFSESYRRVIRSLMPDLTRASHHRLRAVWRPVAAYSRPA